MSLAAAAYPWGSVFNYPRVSAKVFPTSELP
jgi:hypothetical protein